MTREELIQEIPELRQLCQCSLSGGIQVSEDEAVQCQWCAEVVFPILDKILSREKLLLEKIGKPLKDCIQRHQDCFGGKDPRRNTNEDKAIDEALAIIEKEGL